MTNQENETLNLQTAEALRLYDECRSLVMHLPASAPVSEITRLHNELDQPIQTVESLRGPRWDTLKTEQEQDYPGLRMMLRDENGDWWCAANGAWRCGLARWANGMIATYPAPTCAIEHKPVSR